MPRRIAVSILLLLLGVRGLCANVSSVNVFVSEEQAVKKPSPSPTPPPDGPVPTDSGGGPGRDGPVPTDPSEGPGRRSSSATFGGPAGRNDSVKRQDAVGMSAPSEPSNTKIIEAYEIVLRTSRAGNEALSAAILASQAGNSDDAIQKYTAAIAQYDEGLAADARRFELYINKAVALTRRGLERYNAAPRALSLDSEPNAALQTAKNDLKGAAEASYKGVALLKAQPFPTDPQELQRYNANKYAALVVMSQAMKYLIKVEPNYADWGVAAFQEYLAVETDPAKKAQAHLDLAQMLLDAGAADKALTEFEAVLAIQPDNPQANLGAGLALYQSSDKEKAQEAANYLQRFVELAPDTNAMKAEAKMKLDDLKTNKSVTPEKTPIRVRKHQ